MAMQISTPAKTAEQASGVPRYRTRDFDFELPSERIAARPLDERTTSHLMHLMPSNGSLAHLVFADLPDLLKPRDLLVLNDTRVMRARLQGFKESGGRLELLIERIAQPQRALVQIRASRSPTPGGRILLGEREQPFASAEVVSRQGRMFVLDFDRPVRAILAQMGSVPLPSYIHRTADAADEERYQTVYANPQHEDSVAAPTAGLHFDDALLERVRMQGVDIARITLHVGAGTFLPVASDDPEEHQMHSELVQVDEVAWQQVQRTREKGGRIIAVGTTSVRALESAALYAKGPWTGETSLFIYPGSGFEFQVVDCLITNFHLPKSSLLMLVCAFAGYQECMAAYRTAVDKDYRFYSYGDAMFLHRSRDNQHG